MTRELDRYGVDITAQSETRFAERGELTEPGASYSKKGPREAGVGFAIRTSVVRKL